MHFGEPENLTNGAARGLLFLLLVALMTLFVSPGAQAQKDTAPVPATKSDGPMRLVDGWFVYRDQIVTPASLMPAARARQMPSQRRTFGAQLSPQA